MNIETFIKQEVTNLENYIDECNELKRIILNKDISNPKFKRYRISFVLKLKNTIPTTMGRGNERFIRKRQLKKEIAKRQLEEFDNYFNYSLDDIDKSYFNID